MYILCTSTMMYMPVGGAPVPAVMDKSYYCEVLPLYMCPPWVLILLASMVRKQEMYGRCALPVGAYFHHVANGRSTHALLDFCLAGRGSMNSRMCETSRDVFARRCFLRPALAPLVLMLLNLALSKCQKSRATTAVLTQVSSLEPQMQARTCKGRTTLPTCFRKSVCKPGFSFSRAKLRCSALVHGRIVFYRPSRERLAVSTPLSRHQQRRCKANLVFDLRCVQMWPSDTTQWSREMKISFCGFWPRNTFCGIWNIPAADFVYPCSLDAFQPRCFRPRACDRPQFRFWIARSLCFGNVNGREIRYVPSREAIAVGTPLKSSQAAACKASPLLRLQCARTWVRDTRKWTYEMKHALCSWWPHNKRCKTWNLRLAKIPLQMPASSISKHGSRSTINTKSTTTVKQLTTTTSTTTTTKTPQITTTATSTEAPLIPGLTFQKLRSMVHSVRHKAMSNMTETTLGPVSARNVQRHTKVDWKTYHRLARMVRQHRKQPTNKGEIEHDLRAQIVARSGSTQPATTTTSSMPSWAAAVHKYSYFDVMSTTAAATTTPPATTTDFNMRVRSTLTVPICG